jgi:extracellular elastinolytic metalloproteinase
VQWPATLRIALGLGLLLLSGGARAQPGPFGPGYPIRYLTGASADDPLDIALDDLRRSRAGLGLTRDDADALALRDRYVTRRTRITHLYFAQQVDGIDVFGADLHVAVDRDGRILARNERLARNLLGRIDTRRPVLSAAEAVVGAAVYLDLPPAAPAVRRIAGGPAREVVFEPGAISRDAIPVKLMYVPRSGADVRLAWNVVIRTPDGQHWWNLHVDAVTGEVLRRSDWIDRDTYRVYAPPLASPDEGPRSLEADPADPVASPYGWHDTDGVDGPEFTDTRGNNVSAQEDTDADDAGGARPEGGAGLDFDFPVDPTLQPGGSWEAAVANLFYWNNVLHDILYRYGFDEAAGNFQVDNYGNGGSGGDPVQADAQDGSGTDNANFGTPPDGSTLDPRMQMYRWIHPTPPELEVLSPPAVAGTYPAGAAVFGGGTLGLTGDVVQAVPNDACSALTNPGAVDGKVALIDRGTCLFVDKVGNAQDAGAIGAIIVNNQGNSTLNMAGFAPALTIPAVFIGHSDGLAIENALGSGVSATLVSPAARDADFDNGVIIHEYGHGLTNRLTGDRLNTDCLDSNQSGGMGEGWSDFLSLVLTAKPGGAGDDARPMATYLEFQPTTGPGIRNYPYSTDLGTNPLTYADIGSLNWPHGVGEVWAVTLWEMYWNLVDVYGFDSDFYQGSGGNNVALQLVIDGLGLQGCEPTFLTARDSILLADMNATGGANQCLLWAAFAKRGLGVGATDGGGASSLQVQETFATPPECVPFCGDGLLQVGEECDDGNGESFDGCAPTCRTETVLPFSGVAAGGTIDLVIEGIPLSVATLAGQSADEVAANVAAAINADPDLAALGVTAAASASEVATTGEVTSFEVNDPGLAGPALPALSEGGRWLLGAILVLVALLPRGGRRPIAPDRPKLHLGLRRPGSRAHRGQGGPDEMW